MPASPEPSQPSDAAGPPATLRFGGRRVFGSFYLLLAAACLAIAVIFPFVASSPVAGLLLISLPALVAGLLTWRSGWLCLVSRAELTPEALDLRAPRRNRFGLPLGSRRRVVPYGSITALRRRRGFYNLLIAPDFPVAELVVETADGTQILAATYFPKLDALAVALSARSGLPVETGPDFRYS